MKEILTLCQAHLKTPPNVCLLVLFWGIPHSTFLFCFLSKQKLTIYNVYSLKTYITQRWISDKLKKIIIMVLVF